MDRQGARDGRAGTNRTGPAGSRAAGFPIVTLRAMQTHETCFPDMESYVPIVAEHERGSRVRGECRPAAKVALDAGNVTKCFIQPLPRLPSMPGRGLNGPPWP